MKSETGSPCMTFTGELQLTSKSLYEVNSLGSSDFADLYPKFIDSLLGCEA